MNKLKQKILTTLVLGSALLVSASASFARDYIDIVGSSTVYPFSTVVAEAFGRKTSYKTPKIESTGSGGGFKLFCSGNGIATPDITNSSRRIKKSEVENCAKNGIQEIIEVQIGYDGIAIANSKKANQFSLTRKDIFLALAKQVPNSSGDLVNNPYENWSDIDKSLPNSKIEVLGPPPTSGTRDAFIELVMDEGCAHFDVINQLDKKQKSQVCATVREDGAYVEAGENDNLIVEKLNANPNALGIFGFSFLEQNSDKVQGSNIDGVEVSFESIADGSYPVSRPLYFYVKKSHIGNVPGLEEFLQEYTAEETWGEDGYLSDRGLVPLPQDLAKKIKSDVDNLNPLKL